MSHTLKVFVYFIFWSLVLQACTTLDAKLVPLAQSTVSKYCAIPVEQRALIRAQVNAAIAPDKITVACANDPPPIPAARPEPTIFTTR